MTLQEESCADYEYTSLTARIRTGFLAIHSKLEGNGAGVDVPDEKGSLMKTLYIDMDNVLVDFKSGIAKLPPDQVAAAGDELDNVPGIFSLMEPMPGAVAAFTELSTLFDIYILSTAPWGNPTAWSDKLLWVKRYLGKPAELTLTIVKHTVFNNQYDDVLNSALKNRRDVQYLFATTLSMPLPTMLVRP